MLKEIDIDLLKTIAKGLLVSDEIKLKQLTEKHKALHAEIVRVEYEMQIKYNDVQGLKSFIEC